VKELCVFFVVLQMCFLSNLNANPVNDENPTSNEDPACDKNQTSDASTVSHKVTVEVSRLLDSFTTNKRDHWFLVEIPNRESNLFLICDSGKIEFMSLVDNKDLEHYWKKINEKVLLQRNSGYETGFDNCIKLFVAIGNSTLIKMDGIAENFSFNNSKTRVPWMLPFLSKNFTPLKVNR